MTETSPEVAAMLALRQCSDLLGDGADPVAVRAVSDRVAALARDHPDSPLVRAIADAAGFAVVAAGAVDWREAAREFRGRLRAVDDAVTAFTRPPER